MSEQAKTDLETSWWVISHTDLRDLIQRAHDGANPDMLIAEFYANSDHEHVEGNDDDA